MNTGRPRILIVDDNPSDALFLRRAIEHSAPEEFELLHEECLLGALERLSNELVDVVVLDLFLPDSIGLETLEKVKKICPRGPILVMTSLYDQEMAFRGLQMGAQCYFDKSKLEGEA